MQVLQPPRRAVRRAVTLECRVLAEGWDEPVALEVRDLSPSGMFLETSLPLDPGTPMYVALHPDGLDDGREIVARAVVRRVEMKRRRREGCRSGMGVAFVDLPEEDTEALDTCLRGLPPPLPFETDAVVHTTLWVDPLD